MEKLISVFKNNPGYKTVRNEYVFSVNILSLRRLAQVAKLVDALSSGGSAERCAGSSPVLGTEAFLRKREGFFFEKDWHFVLPEC
jgi:hypothetical protein